ncbi:ASKHA domain-containing protein [Desulfoscipio gibsoniae]|uniref:Putative metal-binding protein n=1 Tax=Desulfoscipio gibsoniae DSM 7213 TaxID=767817 RepID=R4KI95_9FIRM|nr:ASKHA domain-containing protein [Desulfoscipio gibsoniae]AGL01352.1 putative metal-binding protein [Desulfoscipio gibsoniae DSM 7213]
MSNANDYSIILQNRVLVDVNINPMSQKRYIELEQPSLQNNQADVDRLVDVLQKWYPDLSVPLPLMNKISDILRKSDWRVTVTVARLGLTWQLIDIEPGNVVSRQLGLAFDIGTTTVVGYLVDLLTGQVIDMAADFNGQVIYGADILTRIYLAGTVEGRLQLQQAVVGTLNNIVERLASKQGVEGSAISAVTVGANSTMVHLLLGLDPSRICMAPYIPVVNLPGYISASAIELAVNPLAPLYCLPSVGSYVGGDIVAGILAGGLHKKPDLALFVDIGTNGEMVLGNNEWLVACSGAAGPALEGGVARDGMRAEPGAVFQVKIDPETWDTSYKTIGGQKALGICGSGLVDCLAELLLAGIIDRAGKFRDGKKEFVVVPAAASATKKDIAFTQIDINNIMRTKGAVNAALEVLLESVGCQMADISTFYAAGAFGQYLDLESAITIGLYPDLPRERMIRLGNSSGEGARLVLLSEESRLEAEQIARNITYFELNANEVFMNKFVGSKFLPHTNLDYYPTVKEKMSQRGLLRD